MSDNKSSRFSACIFSSSCCDFYLFSAQMGAGGFSVSLPCRSRSGCLFVSRQPDKGRRPGLQQRGQLHVTSNPFNARRPAAQVTIRSDHRTSTRHEAHRQRQSDVGQQLFLLSPLSQHQLETRSGRGFSLHTVIEGGAFNDLKYTSDKSEVFSDKMTHSRCFLTPAGVICNQ